MAIILPYAFADTKEFISSINETQFQLKINQTTPLEFDNIKVKFLNVTADSRCPSDVSCVWQGEVKIFVNIVEANQDIGDFSLTDRSGEKDLAVQVFDGFSIQLVKVEPYPTHVTKIPLSDYLATFVISKSDILSPLKQLKSGIAAKDVKCKQGLQLVIKSEDGLPACVKQSSIKKLVLLQWALRPVNELTVEGFKDAYKVGEKIDFVIKFKGFLPCDSPSFIMKNMDNKTVWASAIRVTLCDPDIGYGQNNWQFGKLENLIINQTGSYFMNISISDKTLEKGFVVNQ